MKRSKLTEQQIAFDALARHGTQVAEVCQKMAPPN